MTTLAQHQEQQAAHRFAETPEQVWECLLAGGLRPYEDLPEPPPADAAPSW